LSREEIQRNEASDTADEKDVKEETKGGRIKLKST